jgi:nicotinamide riboside transporter PnuC
VRQRRERELRPLPRRPYRDSFVLNVVLAAIILVLAWATGGDLVRALGFAAVYLVVGTAWSWWRFRERIAREGRS